VIEEGLWTLGFGLTDEHARHVSPHFDTCRSDGPPTLAIVSSPISKKRAMIRRNITALATGSCLVIVLLLLSTGFAQARPARTSVEINAKRASAPNVKPVVTVVGDSITSMSESEIAAALKHGYRLSFRGIGGTSLAPWQPVIARIVARQPPQDWIIELGTNDARFGDTAWLTYLAQEVSSLAGERCVVMVTVNPRINEAARDMDAIIDGVVAGVPNFHSLDWGNAEWSNPEWLQSDGIHPTPEGSLQLASMEEQALQSDCPA
jgi:hypothetical protein